MEVAGLVLGVVPLAITALQCYKTGGELTDLIRNRRRHIEKLIRALHGHVAVLTLSLIWLLKEVNIYEADHTEEDIPHLVQDVEFASIGSR